MRRMNGRSPLIHASRWRKKTPEEQLVSIGTASQVYGICSPRLTISGHQIVCFLNIYIIAFFNYFFIFILSFYFFILFIFFLFYSRFRFSFVNESMSVLLIHLPWLSLQKLYHCITASTRIAYCVNRLPTIVNINVINPCSPAFNFMVIAIDSIC